MTPAEELRQAATTVRKLAADATQGPWKATVQGEIISLSRRGPYGPAGVSPWVADEDAQWIAAMSPDIAEPLADLLETFVPVGDPPTDVYGVPGYRPTGFYEALDIARAINKAVPS